MLAAVLVAGATMYMLSTWAPASYAPVVLDDSRRVQVAQEFLAGNVIDGFGNRVEEGLPFSWALHERTCNEVLASMDEIAYQLDSRGGRRKSVEQAMQQRGFSSPAVSFQNGQITLMVFSDEHRRVLSVDLGLWLDDHKRLRVCLEGARVGRQPLPASYVRSEFAAIRRVLTPRPDGPNDSPSDALISAEVFARVLEHVLDAFDGDAIDPVLVWPGNKRNVRVTGLRLADGELTIEFTPL
jgi:hypothetical protein